MRYFWKYPRENFDAMKAAVTIRHRLLPYIYSMAKLTYDTSVGLVRPLYYAWPELEKSYAEQHEYMFGTEMIVKPIVRAVDKATQMAMHDVWVPPGTWMEWHSGKVVQGPATVHGWYFLQDIPVFLKAGAIVPMQVDAHGEDVVGSASKFPRHISVSLKIDEGRGKSTFTLYDDDGTRANAFEVRERHLATNLSLSTASNESLQFIIEQHNGRESGLDGERHWSLEFPNTFAVESAKVNGVELDCSIACSYNGQQVTAKLDVGTFPLDTVIVVDVLFQRGDRAKLSSLRGMVGIRARH